MSAPPPSSLPNGSPHPAGAQDDGPNGLNRKRGLSQSEGSAQPNGAPSTPVGASMSPPVGLGGGLPAPAVPPSLGGRSQPQQGMNLSQRTWASWSLVSEGHIQPHQADTLFEL